MATAGDTYIITLRPNHLAWGTFRNTTTRTPRHGEAYLPIPIEYARKFNIFNANFTGGLDVWGENLFSCTSADGYLKATMKSQGAVEGGDIYAKQFSVNDDLKAIGLWYQHVGAKPGDQIEVRWISNIDMIVRLI